MVDDQGPEIRIASTSTSTNPEEKKPILTKIDHKSQRGNLEGKSMILGEAG
jgi:hypothetical protein